MEQKKYTMAQASEVTGYKPHVIRFYEKEFKLNFPRNSSNHRYFTESDIDKLNSIKELQQAGYSNIQIKLILNSQITQNTNKDKHIHDIAATCPNAIFNNCINEIKGIIIESKQEIISEMQTQLDFSHQPFRMALTGLAEEINDLIHVINSKRQKETIMVENIKLKMDIKQKDNEIIRLKSKQENRHVKYILPIKKVIKRLIKIFG